MLYRNKAPAAAAAVLFAVSLLPGCGIIDLRPIGCSPFPERGGTVLPADNTAVGVRFDTSMDRLETQKAFSVTCGENSIKGDVFWNGGELSFTPLEGWQAGLRYTLTLSGTIRASDGREEQTAIFVPFFALSAAQLPYLAGFSPEDGASVGIRADEGAVLVLRFSVPMEKFSTEDAVVLEGVGERECFWPDGGTVLEIRPGKDLAPWTGYRWTLSGKALSKEGAPLAKTAGGSFVTDADRLLPDVIEVSPLKKSDPGTGLWWQRTGLDIEEGLGSGQAVGICFNKPMDEMVLRAVRIEPALPGRTEWWTDPGNGGRSAVVFIPDRDPEPETVYTLIVSPDARDRSGLRTGKEYRRRFTPDIPFLSLLSISAGPGGPFFPSGGTPPAALEAPVIMPDGIICVTIRFSYPLDTKARAAAALTVRLEPYFPGILPQTPLRSARWLSEDILSAEWEGAKPGQAGIPYYYRLVLPGGRGGIGDGKGSYLREDIIIYLEAVNE